MSGTPSPPSRRLPLRFSLRVLLLAVTAFAIGFPIWYRWPYEEDVIQKPTGDPLAAPGEFRTITTWQRNWSAPRKRHGTTRILRNGVTSSVSTYRDDVYHGPYQSFFIGTTILAEEGNYQDGKKHGVWKTYNDTGLLRSTTTWEADQLHGPATIGGIRGKNKIHLVFRNGEVVELNRQPVEDRLVVLAREGKIDSPLITEVIRSPAGVEYVGLPITTITDSLSRNFQAPIIVDRRHVDPQLRVDCNGCDIPLGASLTVMAAEHDLACDVRYGCIWITTAEDAEHWHDPTGIAEIVPPADSLLAKSWNETVTIAAIEKPLAILLDQKFERLAIDVDTSQIGPGTDEKPSYPVTTNLQGMKFRHALGILLYQTRCRCKLEGETLVILPPE
jgi:hypothetical protein